MIQRLEVGIACVVKDAVVERESLVSIGRLDEGANLGEVPAGEISDQLGLRQTTVPYIGVDCGTRAVEAIGERLGGDEVGRIDATVIPHGVDPGLARPGWLPISESRHWVIYPKVRATSAVVNGPGGGKRWLRGWCWLPA